jgi:hypothetical protein
MHRDKPSNRKEVARLGYPEKFTRLSQEKSARGAAILN